MSKNNDDIEKKKLEMPTIGDNLGNVGVGDLDRAEISEETQKQYDEIFEKSNWRKIKDKIKKTWKGKNKIGRYVGLGLDVGETFLPKWISRIRDIIQQKTQPKADSNMNWLLNRLTERSTWRGVIVALTSAGVITLGEEMRGAIVSAGVALFVLVEVIVKEPQSKDANK